MRIKKDDNVKVMAGKNRGKTGKVIQAFPRLGKVVVEGVNLTTRHLKVRRQGDKGQKIQFPGPINASNVMLICPKCALPTRIGAHLLTEGGKQRKARTCKKCKEVIE
jgi:large subunit ribosomal protein L24